MNPFLAGSVLPRLQMDFFPGIACAGDFALVPRCEAKDIDDFVAAGRVMQRFWLTATVLGLQLQPEMTPLVFAGYVRTQTVFSKAPGIGEEAARLTARLENLLGDGAGRCAVFMGRIGAGASASARAIRLPLDALMVRR